MFTYFGTIDGRALGVTEGVEVNTTVVKDATSGNAKIIQMDIKSFRTQLCNWIDGELIQSAFKQENTDTCEFIMSGNAWDELMGDSTDE